MEVEKSPVGPGARVIQSGGLRKKSILQRNRPSRATLCDRLGWIVARSGAESSRSSPVSKAATTPKSFTEVLED